ncbi:uncharacterized protein METZ01_LOCUS274596, partial [marine metagenome]
VEINYSTLFQGITSIIGDPRILPMWIISGLLLFLG